MRRLAMAFALLAACTAGEADDGESSDGGQTCEHGTYSACACPDGGMGQQLCAHDTSGYEACMCGVDMDDDASTASTLPADDDGDESTGAVDTGIDPGSSSGGTTGDEASTTTGTDTTAVGEPPTAMINHPGPEDRQVGVPIPFIGVASDPEDGPLAGAAMVWTDSLEGVIGEGEMFDAALAELGEHTVTLTATDADGNLGEDSLTFTIIP